MLTQTIFPCLPQKQENIILEVSNPVLLSSTVTTDGYTVFNKKNSHIRIANTCYQPNEKVEIHSYRNTMVDKDK